ncbi:MAG: hypothetical protein J0L73_06885 [Verrucomicrobia bacterium]|nr:hypothetical protein [Verrucomicrobiota bacterium]
MTINLPTIRLQCLFSSVFIYISAAVLFCETGVFSQSTIAEPELPTTLSRGQGYFPTLSESALLRGPYNSRSGGGVATEEGPDAPRQNATGLFPYEDVTPNFYERNRDIFRPVDKTLGWLTSNNAFTYEIDKFDNTSLTLDGTLGIFTRQFSPELAMFKAGPLFLDVLWVGAGVIWSDYNGPQQFSTSYGQRNTGDGTIAYIDVGLRGMIRITDTIYFSVVGNPMYLPFENRFAFRFATGNGNAAAVMTHLNFSETIGAWDVLFYDQFQIRPGINFYGQTTRSGFDSAGRYSFGFQSSGSANQFNNSNYVIPSNLLSFNATRLVFDNQWRFGLQLTHGDYWRSLSFTNHQWRNQAGAWLGYEGSVIPFAPRLEYNVSQFGGSNTKSDILLHTVYLQLTGRITENINCMVNVGEGWTTGSSQNFGNRFLWQVTVDQTLTQNTRHWVSFGENIFDNSLSNQSALARFIGYGIDHRIARRLSAAAFLQYTDAETTVTNGQRRQGVGTGLNLTYNPLDFTQILATVFYQKTTQSNSSIGDSDRWLYRLSVNQQLAHRLTAGLYYQYDVSAGNTLSYTEHLIGFTLIRYF